MRHAPPRYARRWLVSVSVAICAAVASHAHAGKFWDGYFRIKPVEKHGQIYRKVGAHTFAKFYPNGGSFWARLPWWPRNLKLVRGRTEEDLRNYVEQAKALEGFHAKMLGGTLGSSVLLAGVGNYRGAALYAAINLFANLYPMMSLRMGRGRAEHIVERRREREQASPSP